MKFAKVHGLGNDFVILNCLEEAGAIPESRYGEIAVELCNRNFGIGADGIMLIQPSEQADIRMRIINSDGSEAEMCGNGIRCFARYVYEHKIVEKQVMTVETLAGIMVPHIIVDADGQITGVEVDMNAPVLEKANIPMVGAGTAIAEQIQVEDRTFTITAVSMGNPHCVVFVDDADSFPVEYWGPRIERSAYFPRKTNVEFVQVYNDQEVRMRVWERGAAVTLACGTGACATTVACVLNGKTGRSIQLHLDGGDLNVRWDEATNHLYMTGPAVEVFQGEYPLEVEDHA